MSGFTSFLIGFCGASVLIGMIYLLCPEGTMSSSVRYVFALCFLCSVLCGITGIRGNAFPQIDVSANSGYVTEESVAACAEQTFAEALRTQNIDFRKIKVITDKTDNGGISIIRVNVYSTAPEGDILRVISSEDYEVRVIND